MYYVYFAEQASMTFLSQKSVPEINKIASRHFES